MTFNEMNSTGNCLLPLKSSCSKIYSSEAAYMSLYVFAAVVVLFTMFGNLFVIISVCHLKQLHTPTNILILSLAMSDFLVGLFVMPVHLMIWIESCSLFKPAFCSFSNMISFHLTFVSIYNITFIAVDRYFALSNPFLYSKKVSLLLAFIITTHVWIVSLFYNCALLYFNGNFKHKCSGRCLPYINELWFTADLVIVFILPCATIIILYMKVFFIARRHAVAIRATLDYQNNYDSTRSERKAAKVLGILVSVFLICLIPYYICMLLFDVLAQSYDHVVNIMITLFFLNSTINPLIYALFYPWFQKSMKLIFTFRICKTDSSLMNVLSSGY
ncbi:trace amine-associated receptor 13c-like [Clupea harengus]|uniref:Trace amine-associated receptor 13c-like n=1 Tax=Clupea harengus TaxID=7950 RepID=A0A6P8GEW0_CLUHA|nr:trace amine-associated receptor 13c-like [Clupea harengus]